MDHHLDTRELVGCFKHAVIFHPALPPQGEKTRACELGPTIEVRYAYEPQGIVEGHGTLKTRGPVCWSVPGPELWRLRV